MATNTIAVSCADIEEAARLIAARRVTYLEAAGRESEARGDFTQARNNLAEAQRNFDTLILEFQRAGPNGTEWLRPEMQST
jgi:hypothetical protein